MKSKILITGLICLFFIHCGVPIVKMTKLYPNEADILFTNMIMTLQNLEWRITNSDRPAMFITAEKLTKGEAFSAALSGQKNVHVVSINFIKKNGETSVLIQVSQPGVIMKYTKVCQKLTDEILKKFEEKIKKSSPNFALRGRWREDLRKGGKNG